MNSFFNMPFFPFMMPGTNTENNQQGQNPFPFFPMGQMPFPFPSPEKTNPEASSEGQGEEKGEGPAPSGNPQMGPMPWMWCMNPAAYMSQFQDMWKMMFPMFGMNPQGMAPQGCAPMTGFNPMQGMEMFMEYAKSLAAYAPQVIAYVKPYLEKLKKKESSLPFGLPVQLFQYLLNLDSSPEGLSKLQKILDIIFDLYSKPAKKTFSPEPVPAKEDCEKTVSPEAAPCETKGEEDVKPAAFEEAKPASEEEDDMPEPPEFVKKMIREGKNPEMPEFVKRMLEEKKKNKR